MMIIIVPLTVLFINLFPTDSESLRQQAVFSSISECHQVKQDNQTCVNLIDGKSALYVPR